MPVKIRLQRHGKKSYAFYHIVIADGRAPRDGKFIEKLGTYNPNTNPATIELDNDSALNWLKNGAQPTETARAILSYRGIMMKLHLDKGVIKGAMTQEQADAKFEKWLSDKSSKIDSKVIKLAEGRTDYYKKRMEDEVTKNKAREAALLVKNSPVAEEVIAETVVEAPVAEAAAPVAEVEAPAVKVEAPAVEVEAPAEEVKAPVAEAAAAAVEVEAPAVEVTASAEEVEAPALEVEAPAVEVEAPVAEVEAPDVEVEAPVAEAAAVEVEAPAAEEKAPVAEVEAPAVEVEDPAIEVEDPTVEVEEPSPLVEVPAIEETPSTVETPVAEAPVVEETPVAEAPEASESEEKAGE